MKSYNKKIIKNYNDKKDLVKSLRNILLVIILIIGIMMPALSFADVGDFESYDSDWGSSSWDSDWDSDSSSSYYVSSDEKKELIYTLIFLGIISVGWFSFRGVQSHKLSNSVASSANTQPRSSYVRSQYRSDQIAERIVNVDPHFNKEQFLSFAKNTFIKLQNAWSERDWETIRPLESESLFEQHSKQLQGYIQRKQINKMERICVNFAEFVSFSQDNEKDTLVIALNSSMTDYIIDEVSGKILKGNKDYRVTNTYKMTFIRKKGILTEEGTGELKTTNCPNCGAPTKITSSGRCEYCNSVITIGSHDWVLSDLERF